MSRAITKLGDEILLSGDEDAEVTGLLDVVGIVPGGVIADGLDGLIDIVAGIEGAGGTASHWILAPDTWARLRKMRIGTDSNQNLLGAGTSDSERFLLSLPVLVSSAMPSGEGLCVDSSAIISAAGAVMVAADHSVFVQQDSVAVRSLVRVGSKVVKPGRLGKFSITE